MILRILKSIIIKGKPTYCCSMSKSKLSLFQRLRNRFPLSRQADWALDVFVYMGIVLVIMTIVTVIIFQLAFSYEWVLPEFFIYGVIAVYVFVAGSCLAGLFYGSFCTILDYRRSVETKEKQT
jgi:hypothetical protein